MKRLIGAAAGILLSAMQTSFAAALNEAEANGFKTVSVYASDNFDDTSVRREGTPEIFKAPVSNGLLEYTGQAKYRTPDSLKFGFARKHFFTPKSESRFFAFGFRLYSLEGGSAEILCTSPTSSYSAKLFRNTNDVLACQIFDCGRKPGRFEIPLSALPADIMLYARKDGGYAVRATSLVDGSVRKVFGDVGFFREEFADGFDVNIKMEKDASAKEAVMIIDNLVAAEAKTTSKPIKPTAFVKPVKDFDPDKAGWKKVFEDDFEGTEIDWSKWYQNPWSKRKEFAALDGEGHLAIKCDFIPGTTNLTSTGINSRPTFTYGYVEAKVKFTRNNGWWAAFWLYGTSNTNPGVDGSEIDIFEDYYTRAATPAGPNRPILDHNLHVSVGKNLQSWNYRSELPGTLDDWYVIGCKWTPFEISYYVNGTLMKSKANHSSYDTVTFDAMNHAALNCPLHILFSGCIMRGWGRRNTAGFTFPEYFKIDYVRAWEYPKDDPMLPKVAWKGDDLGKNIVVADGDKIVFEAEVSLAEKTKAEIKEVFLFDCGHPVAVRTAPPWRFEIPFTEEYYRTTRYMAPGRSGKVPPWDKLSHAFRLYVKDANGCVASADGVRWRIPAPAAGATPWKGKVNKLPGEIIPWHFDEGGRGIGHFSLSKVLRTKGRLLRKDTAFDCRKKVVMQLKSGEWMNYTVDVAESAKYRVTLNYGTGNDFPNKVLMLVDGVFCGEFDCPWPGKWDWSVHPAKPLESVELSAGRHTITLAPVGYLSVGTLKVERQ